MSLVCSRQPGLTRCVDVAWVTLKPALFQRLVARLLTHPQPTRMHAPRYYGLYANVIK